MMREFPIFTVVIGSATMIASAATDDIVKGVFGLGLLILGIGGLVLYKLNQIRDAIREGDGKVETVLKQRLH